MLRTPYLVYIGFSTEQFCIIISMASYPLPGLYRIQYKTFCIGLSMASYPQLGLRRIWSALDTTRFCRHMWYQPTRTLSPLKCGLFSWFHRKTDRETDWKVFGFGFGFFRFCCKNRPKPTDIFVKKRKIDRAIFYCCTAVLLLYCIKETPHHTMFLAINRIFPQLSPGDRG